MEGNIFCCYNNIGLNSFREREKKMFHPLVLSLFLYFPEDKSEYGPAAVTFLIFMIGALLTMRLIIKISKREAKKAKELEEKILGEQHPQRNSEH